MIAMMALLLGCGQDPLQGTLSQNVGASFAPCSEAEIKYMASRHNVMTAFDPCGTNKFRYFSWSPTGKHLYFQLVLTGYVMNADAENRQTIPVPTPEPEGPGAWLSANRLAIPVGSEADEEGGPMRFAIFDIEQKTLFYRDVPGVSAIEDPIALSRAELAFIGSTPAGKKVLKLNIEEETVGPAFSWLEGPVDTLSYTSAQQAVALGRDTTVTVHKADSGEVIGTWSHATRGQLSPDGEWMALEFEGEEISIFYQRSWDELSEQARAREIQRVEKFEERLPEGYPTTVKPPTLGLVHVPTGRRWTLTGLLGYRFQWYEAAEDWASFMLWGFEGKQYKRNVVLGNFSDRLATIEAGRQPMGIEPFEAAGAPVADEASPKADEEPAKADEAEPAAAF